MGQNMGIGGGDIQPLKNPLHRGEVFGIGLHPPQQLGIIRVQQKLAHLLPKGEGAHIFLRGGHIAVDDGGPGLHSVCHLVCDVVFYNCGDVVGYQ